jgi:hypothetical protein
MKYRGIEYTLVQGVGQHVWKWSVSLDTDRSTRGQAATKAEAVMEAERAIDRALAPQKAETCPARIPRLTEIEYRAKSAEGKSAPSVLQGSEGG